MPVKEILCGYPMVIIYPTGDTERSQRHELWMMTDGVTIEYRKPIVKPGNGPDYDLETGSLLILAQASVDNNPNCVYSVRTKSLDGYTPEKVFNRTLSDMYSKEWTVDLILPADSLGCQNVLRLEECVLAPVLSQRWDKETINGFPVEFIVKPHSKVRFITAEDYNKELDY